MSFGVRAGPQIDHHVPPLIDAQLGATGVVCLSALESIRDSLKAWSHVAVNHGMGSSLLADVLLWWGFRCLSRLS
ncbi:hypothetical protein ASC61_04695 [Aeromicrobium sp. Root344]|nr:hypothetical protein ASC61_04695 [Aeromicrobium sp. Root344]